MATLIGSRTVSLDGPALSALPSGAALHVRSVEGRETLSELYRYDIEVETPLGTALSTKDAANLDSSLVIGKELTIVIELDGMGAFTAGGSSGASRMGAGTREISGLVTRMTYLGQSGRQSRYRLTIEPWLSLADLASTYVIFQNETVVEIIDRIFGMYPFIYEKRLGTTYPTLTYEVQYGESNFQFAQRLMQEYGIYWFFEHHDKTHRLVITDHLGAHRPVESVAYRTLTYWPPGHRPDREYIEQFSSVEALRPGRWSTDDFDFKRPGARLGVTNELPRDTGFRDYERYEWPGCYGDVAHGELFARLRMEYEHSLGERASGRGNVRDIVCGTTFTLEGFPQDKANREYLVVESALNVTQNAQSTGTDEYVFESSFDVQPSTIVFRPMRTIAPPRTCGPQTATVVGPPGQIIWTDEYGRIKVRFRWDRSGVNDQNASCWIRVAYPWAGGQYGGISIPRIGNEVIVDFENGDPDRPIIVGCVYNGSNMPPWNLPENAQQSGVLTRSVRATTPRSSNALRFDDKQGQEEVWLHAEKDLRTTVEHDASLSVEGNRSKTISGDQLEKILGIATSFKNMEINTVGVSIHNTGSSISTQGSAVNNVGVSVADAGVYVTNRGVDNGVVGLYLRTRGAAISYTGLSFSQTAYTIKT